MARPRQFDYSRVLVQITNLFWEKGFESTSIDDLVRVTGLKKGSLYASYGNKEKLFELALYEYMRHGPFKLRPQATAIGTLCSFYDFLISEVDLPPEERRGCFIFNSCLEFGNKPARLTPLVLTLGKKTLGFFEELIDEARRRGEIPNGVDGEKAAQRAYSAAFTLREMSKFISDKNLLREVANMTLASLETSWRVQSS